MSIYRKDELKTNVPFKGAKSFLLTGKETGSKMLSVSQIVLEPGSRSPLYKITNVEESLDSHAPILYIIINILL